jgi:hypothetical protein
MTMVQVYEGQFDKTKPLPFDIFDGKGRCLARKNNLVSRTLYEFNLSRGNLFITETDHLAWQSRLVGKVQELVKLQNVTISDIASAIPDYKPPETQPYLSRSERMINQIVSNTEALQKLCVQMRRFTGDVSPSLLEVARQMQPLVEQTDNFGLLYSHQQIRQGSATWQAAMVNYAAVLACRVGHDSDVSPDIQKVMRANMLGICLLVLTCLDVNDSASAYTSDAGSAYPARPELGVMKRIMLASELLFATPAEQQSAAGYLERLFAGILFLLGQVFSSCAAQLVQAIRWCGLVASASKSEFLSRVKQRYGAYLPGEFVLLVSREVGLISGHLATHRVPVIIRILDASGNPLAESLCVRTDNPRHRVLASYPCEKIRCELNYKQIFERSKC